MAATNSAHVAEFRSFDLLFARSEEAQVPRYLLLLDMAPAAREAIVAIREAIASSGARLDAEIDALLTERNWRPQLVGCVALVVAGPNESRLASLWGAINRPCWTSPQLVASASLVDEHFDERARARLDRRGGLDVREAVAMPWLLRHSALGPQSVEAHWAEVVAALLRMCELRTSAATGITTYAATEELRKLVATDTGRGGDIAEAWAGALAALLADIARRDRDFRQRNR